MTDEEYNIVFRTVDKQMKLAKKIRTKIAQLELLLQEATKYGMSGKIMIATDKKLVKTEEKFTY